MMGIETMKNVSPKTVDRSKMCIRDRRDSFRVFSLGQNVI